MKYEDVILDKDHLLAFLVRPDTGFTEHYVSSKPLNLYIPYTEYLALVKDLVKDNLDILRVPLNTYRERLYANDHVSLVRLYYYEIAFAGFSELIKSDKRGKLCTRIFDYLDIESNGVPIKKLDFVTESKNFINTNFLNIDKNTNQQELQVIFNLLVDNYHIPTHFMWPKSGLEYNTHMFYTYVSYFSVFKFWKNYYITFKEE